MSSLGTYAIESHSGLTPFESYYFYWFMDTLLKTFLFFSVCQLSAHVVGDKMPQGNMMWLGWGLFVATAWLSFSVTSASPGIHEANTFTSELSRNISLVSCLAITALWIWKAHNNPNDWTANRLVKVLSVYFLLFFLGFGARQMAPQASAPMYVSWMAYAWLPLGCGFALVSQEHPQNQ